MTNRTDPPIVIGAAAASTIQSTYDVVKGAVGEFVFWIGALTAILFAVKMARGILVWNKARRKEKHERNP